MTVVEHIGMDANPDRCRVYLCPACGGPDPEAPVIVATGSAF